MVTFLNQDAPDVGVPSDTAHPTAAPMFRFTVSGVQTRTKRFTFPAEGCVAL